MTTFSTMRRLLPALLGATLLLGACGDDDDDGDRSAVTSIPDETTTSTSSTTTEPPTVAPDVIPQDESQITEEYVEAVLDALYAAMLEATATAREAGFVEEPAVRVAEATNTPDGSRGLLNSLTEAAANGFAGYRDELSPVDVTVLDLHERTLTCAFAEATFDTSGLTTTSPSTDGFRLFVRIVAATEEQRASGLNPTAWVLDELPATDDGSIPERQCEGV